MSFIRWRKRKAPARGGAQQRVDETSAPLRSIAVESISSCNERKRADIAGVVIEVHSAEEPPTYTAKLDDGTGQITLVWVGRKSVPGLVVGSQVNAQGTVSKAADGSLRILEPRFSLRAG